MARDANTLMDDTGVLEKIGRCWQVKICCSTRLKGCKHQWPLRCPARAREVNLVMQRSVCSSQAEEECAEVGADDFEPCVFDVQATGDLDVVGAY